MNVEKVKKHIENNWGFYTVFFSIAIVVLSIFNKELAFSLVAGTFTFYWLKTCFFSKRT